MNPNDAKWYPDIYQELIVTNPPDHEVNQALIHADFVSFDGPTAHAIKVLAAAVRRLRREKEDRAVMLTYNAGFDEASRLYRAELERLHAAETPAEPLEPSSPPAPAL
jgi:isochorismate hydrolase